MKVKIWVGAAIGLCAVIGMRNVAAQTATALLRGVVVDASGAIVPDATVVVVDEGAGVQRRAVTTAAGEFVFPLLRPATYTVRVSRDGFETTTSEGVVLNVGEQHAMTLTLGIAGAVTEVRVVASAPITDTRHAVATIVDRQFIENQPLNGRSFLPLIELAPGTVLTATVEGVQGDFSVNGQRPGTNAFQVDGVSGNFGVASSGFLTKAGGVYPAYSVQGTTSTLASVDAVQEFAVQTSSYAPEFGRQPGAQVSIVTRSGTRRFLGGAFEYFRHSALDANDFFANANGIAKPDLRQHDAGFTLGGPLKPLRETFFFVSYEALRLRQPSVSNPFLVPSLDARAQASGFAREVLASFPLPTGPAVADDPSLATYVGSASNPSRLDAISARVDRTFGGGTTAFVRLSHAPSTAALRGPYGVAPFNVVSTTDSRSRFVTGGVTHILRPSIVNDLRVNVSSATTRGSNAQDTYEGAALLPDRALFGPGVASRETASGAVGLGNAYLYYGDNFANRQRQINIVDTIQVQKGAHELKLGVDFRRLDTEQDGPRYQRYLAFDTPADVLAEQVSFAYIGRFTGYPAAQFTNLGLYAQDTWRWSPKVTVTFGLRYDINPAPAFPDGPAPHRLVGLDDPLTATLAPDAAPLYESRWLDVAPRVGVAYRPSERLVVRGGAGLFYDVGYSYVGNMLGYSLLPYGGFAGAAGVAMSDPVVNTLPALDQLGAYGGVAAYDPAYATPYSWQYNVGLERQVGTAATLSATYVGAHGRRLERLERWEVPGGVAGLPTNRLDIVRNNGWSDYQSLQLQYRRRLSAGFQALASFALSRSIDNAPATDTSIYAPQAPAEREDPNRDRGYSDFDVRQTFTASAAYQLPSPTGTVARRLFGGFAIDAVFRARSATPITVVSGEDPFGFGLTALYRPDRVEGVPLYLSGAGYPGGRAINPAAFDPVLFRQGTLERNAVRGFGVAQLDASVRRTLALSARSRLMLAVDAFNVLNQANFYNPVQSLYSGGVANLQSPNFGVATQMLGRGFASTGGGVSPLYQIGGPRSLQLSARLSF